MIAIKYFLLELIPGCVYGSVHFLFAFDVMSRDFISGLREALNMVGNLGTKKGLCYASV